MARSSVETLESLTNQDIIPIMIKAAPSKRDKYIPVTFVSPPYNANTDAGISTKTSPNSNAITVIITKQSAEFHGFLL